MGSLLQGVSPTAAAGGGGGFGAIVAVDRITSSNAGASQTANDVFLVGQDAGKFTQIAEIIVIGHTALSAGTVGTPITDANMVGTTVIGSQAAVAVKSAVAAGFANPGPSTIIGYKALNASLDTTANTIIGSNALAQYVGTTGQFAQGNVVIGESASQNLTSAGLGVGTAYTHNVIIGFRAGSSTGVSQKSVYDSVIIGYKAVAALANGVAPGGPAAGRNVVIGSIAGTNLGTLLTSNGSADNVLVGYNADAPGDANGNVFIGTGAGSSETAAPTRNVGIGSTADGGSGVIAGHNRNVVIGANATNDVSNLRCVIIGSGAGTATGAAVPVLNDQFLIETVDVPPGGTRRTLLYGLFGAVSPGGLILGHSTPGTNRDMPGFNILKILNGTVTGVAPVGGGFFYVAAGALHWVGSANSDTVLAPA